MKRFAISPPLAALILAVVLFLLSGLLPNGYGSDLEVARAQAINILRLSVFLGIIAAGQTLVIISGSEGIDLSAGSVVTLTAIFTYVIVKGEDDKVLLALLVSLAVGALIGLLNGAGITYLKISPFVMTLGMSGVVTGAIIIANHGNVSGKIAPIMTRLIARPFLPSIPIPNALIIWLIFGFLMWLLLERTTFGKNLFAIGVNRVTCKTLRRKRDWDELGSLFPGGCTCWIRRLPGGWEYRRSHDSTWSAVPLSIHCGCSGRRNTSFGRQRQLLGNHGWRDRIDVDHKFADHHADA